MYQECKWTWTYYPTPGGSIVYPPGEKYDHWMDARNEAKRLNAEFYIRIERIKENQWIVTSCWHTNGKVTP